MVNLADLIERLLDLGVGGEALPRLVHLVGGFEQKGLHLAFGEAAVEIEKGTVFGAGTVAVAVGLAALHEAFDQGSVQELGWEAKGTQETGLALAQRQGGGAVEGLNLAHIYM